MPSNAGLAGMNAVKPCLTGLVTSSTQMGPKSFIIDQRGFYRNRGQKVINLNRMAGDTSPAGKYRCEIHDADGMMQNMFITDRIKIIILYMHDISYIPSSNLLFCGY